MAVNTAFVLANPESPPPPDCGSLVAGTALPWTNPAAPPRLALPPAPSTVHVEIIGHGGNLGYDDELQALLDADPPGGYQYLVTNRSILGEELWRWVTPGEAGYQAVEDLLNNLQGPTIVLALVTNEAAFPAAVPGLADPNYARFASECGQLADHLRNGGAGVDAVWFSAHRMKPQNLMPCWYENLAMAEVMAQAAAAGRDFLRVGPEQHQLHWCAYPEAYGNDFAHTSALGDQLMADAWFGILKKELSGSFELDADPLVAGAGGGVWVAGAAPGAMTWLAFSPSGLGSFNVAALGVELDLSSPSPLGQAKPAGPAGDVQWSFTVPLPAAGRRFWAQALQAGAKSNVVERLVR